MLIAWDRRGKGSIKCDFSPRAGESRASALLTQATFQRVRVKIIYILVVSGKGMDGGLEPPKGPAPASLVLAIRAHERAKSRGEEESGGKRALGNRGVIGKLFSNIREQAGLEQFCV